MTGLPAIRHLNTLSVPVRVCACVRVCVCIVCVHCLCIVCVCVCVCVCVAFFDAVKDATRSTEEVRIQNTDTTNGVEEYEQGKRKGFWLQSCDVDMGAAGVRTKIKVCRGSKRGVPKDSVQN